MSKLLEYLKAWSKTIGLPTALVAQTYPLPQRSGDSDEASTQIVAPFTGYAQVCAWFCYNAAIENASLSKDTFSFSSGDLWGGSTESGDHRSYVPCRKGDTINVRVSVTQDQTNQVTGAILFVRTTNS